MRSPLLVPTSLLTGVAGILALVARNGAILVSFVLLLGGKMRVPGASSASDGPGLPALALGWLIESGVHSWQEVQIPFDSYRRRSATLLAEQDLYLTRQRNKIL